MLAATAILYYTALFAVIYNALLYVVREFDFSSLDVGIAAALLGLGDVIANAVMVQILQPRLGERKLLAVGLVCFGVQMSLMAFAWDK